MENIPKGRLLKVANGAVDFLKIILERVKMY